MVAYETELLFQCSHIVLFSSRSVNSENRYNYMFYITKEESNYIFYRP